MKIKLNVQKNGENLIKERLVRESESKPKKAYFFMGDIKESGFDILEECLIDLKARRIVIPKRLGFIIPVVNHGIKLDTPKNIDDNLELKEVCKRQVLFSDVDLNQHMNNAKYIDWALDSIDFDIHKIYENLNFEFNFITVLI